MSTLKRKIFFIITAIFCVIAGSDIKSPTFYWSYEDPFK